MKIFRHKTVEPTLTATTRSETMKDKADNWQMELANIAWEFEQTLKKSNVTDLNRKPGSQSWSIAEIISHLILVNTSYFPTFKQLLKNEYKPPLLGRVPMLGKKVGEMILDAMKKPRKTKTFEIWQPSSQLYDKTILDRFFDQQHQLSSYVQKLEPLLEKGVMIASPANKWVVYSLDQAIEIILTHEKRHLGQIKTLSN
ncbi:DinB family protein [Negadavirga shengliensis]|uniref:DinB family protein n=1 Tax=Negadavirga shengliensis TaxID=1389218 RepID=A0ABV9T470_9BACT